MRLDIEFHIGDRQKPVIIFIHGLGMDKNLWCSPCEARIGGGLFPFSLLSRKRPDEFILKDPPPIMPEILTTGTPLSWLTTSYHDLREDGYTVVTWSQRRPVGPVVIAVKELAAVIKFISSLDLQKKDSFDNQIILIGHSRGGLIARKYIELYGNKGISALITIATPHHGSTMAEWVGHISMIVSILKPFLKHLPEGRISKAIKRISDFFRSEAIKELLPDSSFIKSLQPIRNIKCYSLAGIDPHLFSLYRWDVKKVEDTFVVRPEEFFSYPESLIRLLPDRLVPSEWRSGAGDGLVSLESARFGSRCCELKLNHANILTDKEARAFIREIVKDLNGL